MLGVRDQEVRAFIFARRFVVKKRVAARQLLFEREREKRLIVYELGNAHSFDIIY